MLIIPAIDIKNGKCVRLFQGDYAQETVYSDDPVSQARVWQDCGARIIHIVDLDAARDGVSQNRTVIEKIASGVGAAIEVGGGIRTEEDAKALFDAGVARVIIGSKAIESPPFVKGLIEKYGPARIVLGIDSRRRMIAYHGWTEDTEYKDVEFLRFIQGRTGIRHVIYTDIMRDGTLSGPNVAALEEMLSVSDRINIICSGGISSEEDIEKLSHLSHSNLEGVIVGKALYDGQIDLSSTIKKYQEVEEF